MICKARPMPASPAAAPSADSDPKLAELLAHLPLDGGAQLAVERAEVLADLRLLDGGLRLLKLRKRSEVRVLLTTRRLVLARGDVSMAGLAVVAAGVAPGRMDRRMR